jgi:hypothetical protein
VLVRQLQSPKAPAAGVVVHLHMTDTCLDHQPSLVNIPPTLGLYAKQWTCGTDLVPAVQPS